MNPSALSLAERIALKRKAQADQLFPAELAIDLALRLDPNEMLVVDRLNLLLDWLGPFDKTGLDADPLPLPYWKWSTSWKTLAIANCIACSQASVVKRLFVASMPRPKL